MLGGNPNHPSSDILWSSPIPLEIFYEYLEVDYDHFP